jgi:hypothetical protein
MVNAPFHVSRRTTAWKYENGMFALHWASQSPDLNIIQNVWKVIKNNITKRILAVQTKEDLVRVANEIWIGLSLCYLKLIHIVIVWENVFRGLKGVFYPPL